MLRVNTTHSPPRRTGREDFPHPALPKTFVSAMRGRPSGGLLQVHQAHALEVLVVTHSLRRSKRPLAPTLNVLRQALAHVAIDLPKPFTRVPIAKVVRPPLKMSVELFNQLR